VGGRAVLERPDHTHLVVCGQVAEQASAVGVVWSTRGAHLRGLRFVLAQQLPCLAGIRAVARGGNLLEALERFRDDALPFLRNRTCTQPSPCLARS
jgi:hypothetical protein